MAAFFANLGAPPIVRERSRAPSMCFRLQRKPPVPASAVLDFVRRETGWAVADGEVEHYVATANCTYATVDGALVGTTFAAPAHDGEPCISYVITAAEHRRKGIARGMMHDILAQCECANSGKTRLMASEMGKALYESLGYRIIPKWELHFVQRSGGGNLGQPLEYASGETLKGAEQLALKAYGHAEYNKMPVRGRQCFALTDNGIVQAAAWMYPCYMVDRTSSSAWLGPVCANTAEHAVAVISGALAGWQEEHGDCEVSALVVNAGGGWSALRVFERAGFQSLVAVPLMRKAHGDSGLPDVRPELFASSGWVV